MYFVHLFAKIYVEFDQCKKIIVRVETFTYFKDADAELECPGCTEEKMFMFPRTDSNKVPNLRRNKGIESTPDIDVAFYHDLTEIGLKGIAHLKDNGLWPEMEFTTCEAAEGITIRNNLDFHTAVEVKVCKNL